jgi:dimethylargininase
MTAAMTAVTREVNSGMGNCELTFLSRSNIDVSGARQQHQEYQAFLSELGCEVLALPSEPGLSDSVFIEDTALVLDEVAVLCRPGAASRRAEVGGVEKVLSRFRDLQSIQEPGTLDGGDLFVVGKDIFAGLSTRSNANGIKQLQHIVADYGYSVSTVETTQCLHLKSAVSEIAPGVLLINPGWVDKACFRNYELVEVDGGEEHAANALLIGTKLIYPSSFPRTAQKLIARGLDVTLVNVSELQKAEGAVTCCSLVFQTEVHRKYERQSESPR